MTDDNSNKLVDMEDNLENFEKDFYGEAKEVDEVEEDVEDTDDDAVATDEDTDAPEGDDEDDSEDDSDEDSDPDEDEEEEPEPQPKSKNRKSFQKRIDEITRRAHEAERRELALLQRLEAIEARERDMQKTEEPLKEKLAPGAPKPDDLDEKGELKYKLGEFDPKFISDLAQFTIDQRVQALEEKRKAEDEAKIAAEREAALEKEKKELFDNWAERLEEAEESNPEIRDHIQELTDSFANLDPSYGEYLALTIMQSENGPDILEYLSQNIGEAQKIVASGPAAATLAIGRIDARVARNRANDEKRNAKRVSDAPEPPTGLNRGRRSSGNVRPDTDNLDAFEREFYRKR